MIENNKYYLQFIQSPDEQIAIIVETYESDGAILYSYKTIIYDDGCEDGDWSGTINHLKVEEKYITEISFADLHKIYTYISSQHTRASKFALKTRIREDRKIRVGDYLLTINGAYHLIEDDNYHIFNCINLYYNAINKHDDINIDDDEYDSILAEGLLIPQKTYCYLDKIRIETRDTLLNEIKPLVRNIEYRDENNKTIEKEVFVEKNKIQNDINIKY